MPAESADSAAQCNPATAGFRINLGNPQDITVLELAERILAVTGSRSRLVYTKLPQDDPRQRCPDIGLARNLLGWTPSVRLDDGLERTIAYFDRLLSDRAIES
jgi:UDP-glucuronate decarboxylase